MIDVNSSKFRIALIRWAGLISLLLTLYEMSIVLDKGVKFILMLAVMTAVTIINDYLREMHIKDRNKLLFHLSFCLSNAVIAYFCCVHKCQIAVLYYIYLMVEMVMFYKGSPKVLMVINIISYSVPYKFNSNPAFNLSIRDIFLNYLSIFVVVFIIKSIIVEKSKVQMLNSELTNANMKLKEYSEQIEQLTISKERTRIAQELHDSIGHSLIALRMNLEFAKNTFDSKPEKSRQVIDNAYTLSKDCILKLRQVVGLLKEDSTVGNLHQGINNLFAHFRGNDRYKFNLHMNDDIEEQSPEIKSCIYKTVMEGLTNGIKHGRAEIFDIKIEHQCDSIYLQVKNNGQPCDDIKKSNGLKGIEKRITDLNGTVKFYGDERWGFIIDAVIPAERRL